jgi:hypothetical protein
MEAHQNIRFVQSMLNRLRGVSKARRVGGGLLEKKSCLDQLHRVV